MRALPEASLHVSSPSAPALYGPAGANSPATPPPFLLPEFFALIGPLAQGEALLATALHQDHLIGPLLLAASRDDLHALVGDRTSSGSAPSGRAPCDRACALLLREDRLLIEPAVPPSGR